MPMINERAVLYAWLPKDDRVNYKEHCRISGQSLTSRQNNFDLIQSLDLNLTDLPYIGR